MLDGGLPFALTMGAGRLFDRVRFALECADLMPTASAPPAASEPRAIVKQHALEILNSRFRSDCLDAVPSTGSNPVLFDFGDVIDLARRAISTAELGWRRGRDSRNLYKTLQRYGVERIATDFWSRSQVDKLLLERLI